MNIEIDVEYLVYFIITIISVFVLYRFLKYVLNQKMLNEKPKVVNKIVKRFMYILNILLALVAIVLAWWALGNIKERVEYETSETIETVLNSTSETLKIWMKEQVVSMKDIAVNTVVIDLSEKLIERHNNGEEIIGSKDLETLRGVFLQYQERSGHIGFFVISLEGINIASMRDSNIDEENIILQHRPDLVKRVSAGETVFVPPIPSDISYENDKVINGMDVPPTMFFATPIIGNNGEIIAILTQRFNPDDDFSKINSLGHLRETGKTYTFNKEGEMLSVSRYTELFIEKGLIEEGSQSILSLRLVNPGGNLENGYVCDTPNEDLPFTLMAEDVLKGNTNTNVKGYTDYRGVKVVGSWTWLEDLGIGMATEIDYSEAFDSYFLAKRVFIIVITSILSISLFITLLASRLNKVTFTSLLNTTSELEMHVDERTKELHVTMEKLELANRNKTLFLSNMSREIHIPITALLHYSKALKNSQSLNIEQRRLVNSIENNGKMLNIFILDLLEMSNIVNDDLKLSLSTFNLHELLKTLFEVYMLKFEQKNIAFVLNINEDVPKLIRSDEKRIRQILTSLISNALKFTVKGHVHVNCRLNDTLIEVDVKDTGFGIDDSRVAQIFEAFEKNDESKGTLGLGIGLTISKKIAQIMGGNIAIRSTMNVGSTFTFSFPLGEININEVIPGHQQSVISLAIDQEPFMVMVVDDNKDDRLVARFMLEGVGFKVLEAENGNEAVEVYDKYKPQIILMDTFMPNMNGDEAINIIRSKDSNHALAIFALLDPDVKEVEQASITWADNFIRKPYVDYDIYNKIKQYKGVKYSYVANRYTDELQKDCLKTAHLLPKYVVKQLLDFIMTGDFVELKTLSNQLKDEKYECGMYIQTLVKELRIDELREILESLELTI